jgi:hypothetical protein
MRTRTREVQIFNMSLVDILCGALGAFCFMMLVLLPYYKPANEDLRKQEANTQDLLKQLEKLKNAAKDSTLAQQMADVIRKLQDQITQLQGQLNQFAAQNERLKTENQNLTAKNDKQFRQLDMRRPFVTMAVTDPPQDVGIYLDSDGMTEEKKSNPPFDPANPHQPFFFAGDISGWWSDHGAAVWMTRDAPAGVHYKLYVKIPQATDVLTAFAAPPATTVKTMALGDTWKLELPDVTLNSARFWALVGTFTVNPDEKLTFKEASQAERDAEWTKLSKSTPPPKVQPTATGAPVMPFSNQTGQPSATPKSAEEWHAYMEKIEKERAERLKQREQQQSQPASPSAIPIGPGGMRPSAPTPSP